MRLVTEVQNEDPELSLNAAVNRIGQRVGVVPDTLRGWCRQAAIDAGSALGRRPAMRNGSRRWRRRYENSRANAILLAAVVVQFFDDHRARFGVEPICRVLTEHGVPIAPSGSVGCPFRAGELTGSRRVRCP